MSYFFFHVLILSTVYQVLSLEKSVEEMNEEDAAVAIQAAFRRFKRKEDPTMFPSEIKGGEEIMTVVFNRGATIVRVSMLFKIFPHS